MNREKFREMYDLLMEQLDVSRELSDDEILGRWDRYWRKNVPFFI